MLTFVKIIMIPLLFCACINTIHGEKSPMYYMSIEELYRSYAPGNCGQDSKLEGKEVHIRGYVDRENYFDKKTYPQLPYEKFKIYDKQSGKSIEVWAVAAENNMIFKKIEQNAATPDREAFISGIISSFDMPIMGTCRKGIKIEIKNVENIFFK
jgi:hypothetical protein